MVNVTRSSYTLPSLADDVTVYLYRRAHVVEGDKNIYKADIVGPGFDHHGLAPTMELALLRAAAHWESRQS